MSQLDKLRKKLYRVPIPNDMRLTEVEKIVKAYGCIWTTGGNHQYRIVYKGVYKGKPWSKVIPLPCHGDIVDEVYIKEIKQLIDEIGEKQ